MLLVGLLDDKLFNSLSSGLLLVDFAKSEPIEAINVSALQILGSEQDLILTKVQGQVEAVSKEELLINRESYLLTSTKLCDKFLLELTPVRTKDLGKTTHELKRPLQNIKALTEALIMGAKNDPAKLDQYLGNIVTETDRMGALVNDLLKLAHLSSAGFALQKTQTKLLDVLTKTIGVLKSKANEKNISIDIDFETGAEIQADEDLLNHLLENLIDNAIKYNRDGGSVQVSYTAGELTVTDTGIGIAAEDQKHIFEDFYRVPGTEQQSTGLGLAIVKRIADLHGWTLELSSELEQGSSFKISLL